MSKKSNKERAKLRKQKEQEVFDAKIFFKRSVKKYLWILLFSIPLIIGVNLLIQYLTEGLSSAVMIIIDIVILLICCLVGIFIFSKIDERKEKRPKEDKRDPFAD